MMAPLKQVATVVGIFQGFVVMVGRDDMLVPLNEGQVAVYQQLAGIPVDRR